MLKISRLADYATVIMHYLAGHTGRMHSAAHIAEATKLSTPTVSKLLKQLNEGGLVSSVRGSSGGYQLARPAEQISLVAMIAAVDGQPAVTQCADTHETCVHNQVCGLRGHWQFINQVIVNVLENLTLADLCKPISETRMLPIQFHGLNDAQQQRLNQSINTIEIMDE